MLVSCLLASLLVCNFDLALGGQQHCDKDYHFYKAGNTCFKINSARLSWDDAVQKCKAEDADLLTIDTAEKNEYVTSKMSSFIWIGFRRNKSTLKFENKDGGKLTYTHWRKGEPDNEREKEHCVILFGNQQGKARGLWSDNNCGQKLPYGCEKKPTSNTAESSCRPGYSHYKKRHSCIKVSQNRKSWDDARAACRADNADLVQIEDAEKNAFVTSKLYLIGWIGPRRNKDTLKFENVDGTKLTYSNWRKGQPDNNREMEHCVMLFGNRQGRSKGTWADYNCRLELPYACEAKLNSNAAKPSMCKPGFSHYENDHSCIKVFNEKKSWDDASAICKVHKGNLVDIDTPEKNAYVSGRITGNFFFWIGARVSTSKCHLVNAEGKDKNFRNNCRDLCVRIKTDHRKGDWDEFDCKQTRPFVCEYALEKPCDKGYLRYNTGNTCMKVVNEVKSWADAKANCEAEKANLVVIDSAEKDAFVTRHSNSISFFWIGLHRTNNGMVHVDGTKMTYSNWKPGQPDNWGKKENCIMKFGNARSRYKGLWNDLNCAARLRYICERK